MSSHRHEVLERAKAATDAFNRLDTTKLIFEAAAQLSVVDPAAWEKGRKNQAIGASYAMSKALYYFDALGSIDKAREEIGRNIARLLESLRIEVEKRTDAEKAAELQVSSWVLAGRQEVMWHLFSNCASKLATLLPIAARGAGSAMSADDKNFLRSYKDMRDHFEHLDERLPGKAKQDWLIQQVDNERLVIGLASDGDGRVMVNGKPVDVTSRGYDRIQGILQSTVDAIRRSCLEQLEQFFLANPEHIPDPDDIPDGLQTHLE